MAGTSALGYAHDRGGRGLVAVDEQHYAVQGLAADHLFRVHSRQIAVEHGRGVEVDFAE